MISIAELYDRYRDFDLLVDSRQLLRPGSTLFLALPGRRSDGHDFIPDLYARGVRHFVVSRPVAGCPQAEFHLTQDVLAVLQDLAAHHRARFDIPVLGITGSNGKTTVKEWIAQLLEPHLNLWRSPRSFNSQIGVPLSVWQLREEHDLAIFEAGISQRGEMQKLARIIRPTIGLFTNIGAAHREGFASREEKLAEKWKLFDGARQLIVRLDNPEVRRQAAAFPGRLLGWSDEGEATVTVRHPDPARDRDLVVNLPDREPVSLQLPLGGPAIAENAVNAFLFSQSFVPAERLAPAVAQLQPLGLRLEVRAGRDGSTLVDDSYSNDISSLATALTFARDQGPDRPLTLILSDIPQTGLTPEVLYTQVARLLSGRIDRLIGIGRDIPVLGQLLPAGVDCRFYPSTEDLLAAVDDLSLSGQLVLVKGARAYGLERISARLARQVHRTILEVDLAALDHNLAQFRSFLRPETRVAAMIKASAYGSGAVEVARQLQRLGVHYLVVAYTDEGVALRQAGISLPILVLNSETAAFDALLRYELEPEIFSWEQLRDLADHTIGMQGRLTVHLKFDTGMHRLGFRAADAPAVGRLVRTLPQMRVGSVFTHLAGSDEPAHDDFTREQVRRFSELYTALEAELGYRPIRHVLNTSGIARFPEYQFEMVRLGIGLYGVEASTVMSERLRPVQQLWARVSQVREVPAGATVGYGRRGRLQQGGRIAVLSIGYADGLPRAAGPGGFAVQLHGQSAPLTGSVCMDMCMVDVTHLPQVTPGDRALIFGRDWPVERLAEAAGTIPYEIFTGIGPRVHRVYISE